MVFTEKDTDIRTHYNKQWAKLLGTCIYREPLLSMYASIADLMNRELTAPDTPEKLYATWKRPITNIKAVIFTDFCNNSTFHNTGVHLDCNNTRLLPVYSKILINEIIASTRVSYIGTPSILPYLDKRLLTLTLYPLSVHRGEPFRHKGMEMLIVSTLKGLLSLNTSITFIVMGEEAVDIMNKLKTRHFIKKQHKVYKYQNIFKNTVIPLIPLNIFKLIDE